MQFEEIIDDELIQDESAEPVEQDENESEEASDDAADESAEEGSEEAEA